MTPANGDDGRERVLLYDWNPGHDEPAPPGPVELNDETLRDGLQRRGLRASPTVTVVSPQTLAFAQPVQTTRTFEAAIENIVEGIERTRLRRGGQLPSEGDLAAQLGISKPTLRQALRVLERAGLLSVRQGKGGGIFVKSELIPSEAILGAVALEESFIVDVLRGRRVLETAVTGYAAEMASPDDHAEIERSIDLLRRHLGDRAMVMRADAMFHRAVVRATRNQTLQAAMRGVARDLAAIRDAYSGGIGQDARTLDVHSRQLEAMRARDDGVLSAVIDQHFRMLEEAFADAIGRTWADLFGRPGP
jgi:DNA-binding FadR family transcriptional regulator